MRRVALLLFGLALALLAGRAALRAMASEETKIRRLVEDMAAGFDAESPNRSVAGLSREWRDASSGIEREWLRQGLIRFFMEAREPATRAFRYRLELPDEALVVALDPEHPSAAQLSCVARFFDRAEVDSLAWEVAIEAELERGRAGWEIVRSEYRTIAGERLGLGR